jgi:riboflavin biosynthesis pyrimidine reductase
MTNSIKDTLKKYLGEVIAIFIGISISFWFDEWRENRKDREAEQKILQNLKENLVQDSLMLGLTAKGVKVMVEGAEKLIQAKQNADIADSLSYYIDMAASYTGILTNQTTYEEIKQTGKTSLIQDDTLKKSILGHYTTLIPYVKEWCEVDKTHTMTQLIPEMSNYFPVIIDTANIVPADQKIKYLQTPKLKHLLITNLTYKKEAVKSIEMANANTKRLIARIDKVLKE